VSNDPLLAPRGRRKALEPERPDYSEPDFSSWSAKLDAFVPKGTPTVEAATTAAEPAAVQPAAPASFGLNESLQDLIAFEGAISAALVDSDTGMILGRAGSGPELDLAAAGASVMLRARRATVKTLGLPDVIEDVLVTLTTELQIIRPLTKHPTVFLYLVVDKAKSSLAMARFKATEADGKVAL
jgi:predicted regulator of Ras-like GTPase activity (Roadblock/LC7/MglB family)